MMTFSKTQGPTLADLLNDLAAAGKPISKRTLQRYLEKLGIGQAGARQNPNRYPADTLALVLAYLGMVATAPAPAPAAAANGAPGILSLPEIKRRAKRHAKLGVIL